jgi:hypothetical protein
MANMTSLGTVMGGAVAILVCSVGTGSAQPGHTAAAAEPGANKSESTALLASLGVTALGVGMVYVAGDLYDFIDAPRAARRTNARLASLQVAPAVMRTGAGSVPAVMVGGSF